MERWREKGWDKQREREMKQRYREKERWVVFVRERK